MLIKLINYELNKRWMAIKYVLLGYILLQALLLVITRGVLWHPDVVYFYIQYTDIETVGVPFALFTFLYYLLATLMGVFPLIESLYRFNKDLSGKQAVLELMLPIMSWKKVVSKLTTTLFSSAVCIGVGGLSVVTFIAINANFPIGGIVAGMEYYISEIVQAPLKNLTFFLYSAFVYASLYLIAFLCISFSKTLTHKNKIAVPIGILAFVACMVVVEYSAKLTAEFPIYAFQVYGWEYSISSGIIELLLFLGPLLATSWLMDNKIEC